MKKSLKYLAILALIPLFTAGLGTSYVQDAEAAKGQGVGSSKYGSSTNVCGLQLCSEYPGGKAAWIAEQEGSTAEVEVPQQETEEEMMSMTEKEDASSMLKLSRANVPATIPMHQGYYDGDEVYFIITDSSDPTHADLITENQGWKVELAPLLANTPAEALSKTYMFTNGIEGDGVLDSKEKSLPVLLHKQMCTVHSLLMFM